jgi:hypothetical protein
MGRKVDAVPSTLWPRRQPWAVRWAPIAGGAQCPYGCGAVTRTSRPGCRFGASADSQGTDRADPKICGAQVRGNIVGIIIGVLPVRRRHGDMGQLFHVQAFSKEPDDAAIRRPVPVRYPAGPGPLPSKEAGSPRDLERRQSEQTAKKSRRLSWVHPPRMLAVRLSGDGLISTRHHIVLCHKLRRERRCVLAAQHGHRDKMATRLTISRRRRVAMEFGT